MKRIYGVSHQYVEYIPEQLHSGVLYISKRFRTASHLCCCGCGMKVVTPLNPAKWRLSDHGENVSLAPSIGNWSFPCRSHYFIIRNQVRWAGKMSQRQVNVVQELDRIDVERLAKSKSLLEHLVHVLRRWFK